MSASSLSKQHREDPKQVEKDYSDDPIMEKLHRFIEGKVLPEEEAHFHEVLSAKVIHLHNRLGKVLDFDILELKKAEEGRATRSAVQKIFAFFERWAA